MGNSIGRVHSNNLSIKIAFHVSHNTVTCPLKIILFFFWQTKPEDTVGLFHLPYNKFKTTYNFSKTLYNSSHTNTPKKYWSVLMNNLQTSKSQSTRKASRSSNKSWHMTRNKFVIQRNVKKKCFWQTSTRVRRNNVARSLVREASVKRRERDRE